MTRRDVILGIDLGTTNSVVAVVEGGRPVIIPNLEGSRVTRSVVTVKPDGETVVGEAAARQAAIYPQYTVASVKRLMGRSYRHILRDEPQLPQKIQPSPDGGVSLLLGDRSLSPQHISARILSTLRDAAEAYLGGGVHRAVITVPAYFDEVQREATRDAAELAGLQVERIINEPTAAALAYGLEKKQSGTIAVFDLGGGTFDISILKTADGVYEVLSTCGNMHLGGDDFDAALVSHVAREFERTEDIDLLADPQSAQRVREMCEKAKSELSFQQTAHLTLPFAAVGPGGAKHLDMQLSRATFESVIAELVDRCREPIHQALRDAGIRARDVDHVVLAGGSTRIPRVQQTVEEIFGQPPQRNVNPDEVVAIGAALQGGILAGTVSNQVLLDVTPLSLGVETAGGTMAQMIARNTKIPASNSQIFTTASEQQTFIRCRVFQGEADSTVENRFLGEFVLSNLPADQRPRIEVHFDIDVNGLLTVSAQHAASGLKQSIRIERTLTRPEDLAEADRDEPEQPAEPRAAEVKNQAVETPPVADRPAAEKPPAASEPQESTSHVLDEEFEVPSPPDTDLVEGGKSVFDLQSSRSADTSVTKRYDQSTEWSIAGEDGSAGRDFHDEEELTEDVIFRVLTKRGYRVLEKLGQGAMGEVYRAEHGSLGKPVAIKVLTNRELTEEDSVMRFKREMKAVGQLNHENIVKATNAGVVDNVYFLEMELVDGVEVRQLIKGRPLPVKYACEITRQVALGLQHAHEQRLVHRDLKPANLLLDTKGVVKILDFGLTLLKEDKGHDITKTKLLGTIDYLAPEQATRAHEVDIRADIYSLGCSLYHLLTGRVPYSGPKMTSVTHKLVAHMQIPFPDVHELRPGVPGRLKEILERMVAKDPSERFDEPRQVAAALASFCENADLTALLEGHGARKSAAD